MLTRLEIYGVVAGVIAVLGLIGYLYVTGLQQEVKDLKMESASQKSSIETLGKNQKAHSEALNKIQQQKRRTANAQAEKDEIVASGHPDRVVDFFRARRLRQEGDLSDPATQGEGSPKAAP